jgi:hypothetical protein
VEIAAQLGRPLVTVGTLENEVIAGFKSQNSGEVMVLLSREG